MEFLTIAWTWLASNWDTLLLVIFTVELAAVQIVNLTPTPVDNKVLVSIHKVLVMLANLVPTPKSDAAQKQADDAMKDVS